MNAGTRLVGLGMGCNGLTIKNGDFYGDFMKFHGGVHGKMNERSDSETAN